MLSNLSCVQHALIKTEKPGLGREERPSLSFPICNWVAHSLGLCLEPHGSSVCLLWAHSRYVESAPLVVPRHMAAKTRLRKAEQSVIVLHRSLSLSQASLWVFFCKVGRKNKIWPCFHSLCLPGAFREYKTSAKKSGCSWAGSLELHISLPWMATEFFSLFFLSPAATWDFYKQTEGRGESILLHWEYVQNDI